VVQQLINHFAEGKISKRELNESVKYIFQYSGKSREEFRKYADAFDEYQGTIRKHVKEDVDLKPLWN